MRSKVALRAESKGTSREINAMRKSAPHISKHSLSSLQMSSCRELHKLTQLMDTKGQIWSSKGEVLQCSNHASISRRIRQGHTRIWSKSCGRTTWGFGRLGVMHIETMKNIRGILSLG